MEFIENIFAVAQCRWKIFNIYRYVLGIRHFLWDFKYKLLFPFLQSSSNTQEIKSTEHNQRRIVVNGLLNPHADLSPKIIFNDEVDFGVDFVLVESLVSCSSKMHMKRLLLSTVCIINNWRLFISQLEEIGTGNCIFNGLELRNTQYGKPMGSSRV